MIRKLLIPLDGSSLAEQAIGQACAIARGANATLDVVQVVEPPLAAEIPVRGPTWSEAHTYIESIADEIESGATIPTTHAALTGEVTEMICRRAMDTEADLIVMTSRGRTGFGRAVLGSIADGVVRRSFIPVLLMHPAATFAGKFQQRHTFRRILVPLDGSAASQEILPAANDLARAVDAQIQLLRVVQPVPVFAYDVTGVSLGGPPIYQPALLDDLATTRLCDDADEQLAAIARTLEDRSGVAVGTQVVVADSVATAIINFARGHHIDGIAMATHGRGASRLIIGSVADKVLRHSGMPLLLRRPPLAADPQLQLNEEAVAQQLPMLATMTGAL